MIDEFLDFVGISGIDRVYCVEFTVNDGSRRHQKRLLAAVVGNFGEVAVAKEVLRSDAAALSEPFRIEGRNGFDVRQVDVLREGNGILRDILHVVERHFVHHDTRSPRVVQVDGAGDTAHEIVGVRIFSAEDGVNFDDFLLEVERFKVMRYGEKIYGGRQLHLGVPPVAVFKDAELARIDEFSQTVLHVTEITGRGLGVRGTDGFLQCGRFSHVGLEGAHDVHPVERRELIKVHQMVVRVKRRIHQVADEIGVFGNVDRQSVLDGAYGRKRVNPGADAADAFDERPSVAGVAALQNHFEPPPHGAGALRINNDVVVVDFGLNPQVTFNAGDGIDDDTAGFEFSHDSAPNSLLVFFARACATALNAACAAAATVTTPTVASPTLSAVASTPPKRGGSMSGSCA